jgi:hypothetical protein
VRESFSEYKKTLEQNLLNISFMYSGDAISSVNEEYSEIKTTPLTSPSFIINSIVDIYNRSFKMMSQRAKEVVISEHTLNSNKNENLIDRMILSTTKDLKFVFGTDRGRKLFGISNRPDSTRAFPSWFYTVDTFVGLNFEFLQSPNIIEDEDEHIFYVTDSAIQSLVYSIQNMDYLVVPIGDIEGFTPKIPSKWKHTVKYNLYDCKFNSWKIIVKNLSKIRNEKIDKLLNGN